MFRYSKRRSSLFAVISLLTSIASAQTTHAAECDLKQAVERHQQFDNFMEQKFDHYWYGTHPTSNYHALRLETVHAMLPPRTAILFYELSNEIAISNPSELAVSRVPPDFMCVWLLGSSGAVLDAKIPLLETEGRAILTLADDIRTSLASDDELRGWRAPERARLFLATTGQSTKPPSAVLDYASYFLLPRPIPQAIQSGDYDRLIIVPSRNFGEIPYAALPIGGYRQLIDVVSVVVMPSFTALPNRIAWVGPVLIGRSFVVGDPIIRRPDKLVKRGMFEALPGARDEAQQVARALGVKPLLGADASQKAVMAHVMDSDLIYFATHGVANDLDPNDRSYLVLSDGALTARKIAKLRLSRGPIVVMSACQTGLGKTFESGVIGLAKAWKYAGASTVVMSLWSIYDSLTRDLMVEFIDRLKDGQPTDLALQAAMRRAKAKYRHPVFWAGFMIYGAPSPRY